MTDLRAELLAAHVEHELAFWQDGQLQVRIDAFVHDLFTWFGSVKLDELVTSAQIMGVIERYVIELRVSGGIVELAGEFSQLVLDSPASADARLQELLGDDAYESFAEKVAHLDGVWRELITRIARSEAAELAHAMLISRLFGDLVKTSNSWLQRVVASLEARVAEALASHMRARGESAALQREERLRELLEPELVRSVADEVWTSVAHQPLRDLFQFINKQDLEDFVVLGFEFWLSYRKSDYFHRITQEMVEHFFRKYGPQTVLAWIEDMGVSEAMVADEVAQFLGPIVAQAASTGFLERQLRAQLGSFYDSPVFAQVLAACARPHS